MNTQEEKPMKLISMTAFVLENDLENLIGVHRKINFKIVVMEWIYTKDKKPIAYKSGHWDGKNSDQVVAQDESGTLHLAHFCEGFMDGSAFEDWYDSGDYQIDNKIIRWFPIPD